MSTPKRPHWLIRVMIELSKLIMMIFSRDAVSGLYRHFFGD